jgi:hypothetical protein
MDRKALPASGEPPYGLVPSAFVPEVTVPVVLVGLARCATVGNRSTLTVKPSTLAEFNTLPGTTAIAGAASADIATIAPAAVTSLNIYFSFIIK